MSAEVCPSIEEAVMALRHTGFDIREWTMLSESNRIVVALEPCALVAKIVPRAATQKLERELAIASHCAKLAAPVVPPAPNAGPHLTSTLALSLWERVSSLGIPSAEQACQAYVSLRRALDSFSDPLPDFREAIESAREILEKGEHPGISSVDARFLLTTLDAGLARVGAFGWRPRALHGDAHLGNLTLTAEGALWLDFEAACRGPVEWDLSGSLANCVASTPHDRALLGTLARMRSACVVAWCAAKATPSFAESEAIAHHLGTLRAGGASVGENNDGAVHARFK